MALSLEELLVEEGFKVRSSARSSFKADAARMSSYTFRDQHMNDSVLGHRYKTERARSDVARHSLRNELPPNDNRGRRSRDNVFGTEKKYEGLKKESRERRFSYLKEGKSFRPNLSKNLQNEIEEDHRQDDERFRNRYSNKFYSSERENGKYSNGAREKEAYKERSGRDTRLDKLNGKNLAEQMLGRLSFNATNRKSMKKPINSNETSKRHSWNSKSSFEDNQSKKRDKVEQVISEPALDKVAIQAIVSILNGYIKRFLNDEEFRTTLHHNCFSSLTGLEEGHSTESKVMATLEQAIEAVEMAAENSSKANELKKASLKLSVITGLYSNGLKDGFTSGIPNLKLSACAHLYLGVVYKLQEKQRTSAKHLLQVFCIVPFQARTILLPELWDYLFSPHLSHLKAWYNQQAASLADTPSRSRKLKFLEEVYNEILDSGTNQFAVYYNDWLTEGVQAPPIPIIHFPELSSSMGSSSPQPAISKKLYDAVIGRSNEPGIDKAEEWGEADGFNDCMRSSGGSAVVKGTLAYSSETVKYMNFAVEEDSIKSVMDDALFPGNELSFIDDKEWRLYGVSTWPESNLNCGIGDAIIWHEATGNSNMPDAAAQAKENDELTIRSLEQSILDQPHNAHPIKIGSSVEELRGRDEYSGEHSFFPSILQGFICPLTGKLFEDPVTIETGQTFERVAIKVWFDQGNKTCPVTGKPLESLAVPLTNFVLKSVIDNWRSEHCRNLLVFAFQVMENSGRHGLKHLDESVVFMLKQLLTAFSEQEKRENAKLLISHGGLHFLLQRLELGKLEEKSQVVVLLSCCIEADATCRNQIARNINKRCLLQLLQSKQIKSRRNAMLLLSELIFLKRWKDVTLFVRGLLNEGIVNMMPVLLEYLQSSPKDHRPLAAVLLLHLDLLVEPKKYSIYREKAIDAITVALEDSLVDEKVQEKCCQALLILGGRFSFSGKLLTGSWTLKQAGFKDICGGNSLENEDENLLVDDTISLDDEEQANEEWLSNLSAALLTNGKKSFLDTISKCLGAGNLDVVRVCLTTVAWLSCALCLQSNAEFQLSAFSAVISGLKENLENGVQMEHKILASMSLLNFSKISECRVLLMAIAEEIAASLESLTKVTWTAKQLYAIVSGGDPSAQFVIGVHKVLKLKSHTLDRGAGVFAIIRTLSFESSYLVRNAQESIGELTRCRPYCR
ncbi:putative E3 ubiquitin-protein ligase LIN [Juglans microcarpa x Juglans regia]|uniref:putative E3 ubiquitin-protein ligase LIN n=1 Tax=Juglans microcarpa x Juglans regia TaxID=2249226 RepID=UPI001B7F347A|nr:putative E3 ubiquitin-protein ligase LIN [Juglans microcarpa x Juglans regia]